MTMFDADWQRDSARQAMILQAHLDAGRWKAEAWALLDSLLWAIRTLNALPPDVLPEDAVGQYRLAVERAEKVRKGLAP